MKRRHISFQVVFVAILVTCLNNVQAWQSDNGDGTFENLILYSDCLASFDMRVSNDFHIVTTASAEAALRGRPRLNAASTTFVADNGQPLRGPCTSPDRSSAAPADQIANMRNLGFNTVHYYSEVFSLNWPTSGNAPGYNVMK